NEIDVSVGVFLPAFAFQDAPRLTATGVVAGPRHGLTEGNALTVLAVLSERTALQTLLITHLDAGKVQDAVLHGAGYALSLAAPCAMVESRDDAERQMQAGTTIADLCARDERRAIAKTGGRRGATRTLSNVFIDLAIFVGSGAEAFHRCIDYARVEHLNAFPGKAHAIERARREVFNEHVAALHQTLQNFHAPLVLAVDGDRALVVVQHG